MHMIDAEREQSVRSLQLYLSSEEAIKLRDDLSRLLQDPEANEHFHLGSEDMSREISYSIVTPSKLDNPTRYTKLERVVFAEK